MANVRAIRVFCAKICAVSLLVPSLAHADASAKLHLRGVVYPRAVVGLSSPVIGNSGAIVPGSAGRMAVELRPGEGASAAVFHLNRLSNSSSGFVVKLEAGSAVGKTLRLATSDGATIPYNVRFAGRDVAFEGREAELATVTRNTPDDENSGRFEILTPRLPVAAKGFSDRIILVVAAR